MRETRYPRFEQRQAARQAKRDAQAEAFEKRKQKIAPWPEKIMNFLFSTLPTFLFFAALAAAVWYYLWPWLAK